jgi:crotonobetainyl-CoA:carnitine CoA-transferase CaiB-like acyl-CoA transferase
MDQALSDVRVIDLTQAIAGPYCTKLLADLGADVLKIERPEVGDPARRAGPFPGDEPHAERSGLYLHLNTNKRGITLDLKTAFGREVVRELAREADLLVESFRPGTMEGLGLGYAELAAINPGLTYTSISSFGQNGPYRDWKGTEIVFYAMGGSMHSTGLPEREPLKLAGTVCQCQAGNLAAAVSLMAFYGARDRGQGQHLDVSIFESQAGSVDRRMQFLVGYVYSGYITRREDSVSGAFPSGVYPCKDGFFDIAGGGVIFPRTCQMMGRPDLLEDPRFATVEARRDPANKVAFEEIFRPWALARTKRECMEAGQSAKVYCGAIFTPEDVVQDPHFRSRDCFAEIYHPETGPVIYPGAPFKMSQTPWAIRRPAPLLGEHNAEVYCGRLGYSPEELVMLRAEGLI